MKKKIGIVVFILLLVGSYFYFDLGNYLTLDSLQENKKFLFDFYQENRFLFIFIFFLVYVVTVATSIPGATILSLTGGFILGRWVGTLVVALAACIGATLAMLFARFLFGESLQKKYKKQLAVINQGIEKDGNFYLLSLRLIPIFPFFVINLLMGLTTMPVFSYYIISQIGILPGSFIYVNAGTALASIEKVSDILSLEIFLSFALLGVIPLIIKFILTKWKNRN